MSIPAISAVVPNYNYKRYLRERLGSIAGQTHPVHELIVLDDASTDGSGEWLKEEADKILPGVRLEFNKTNSGSVFGQWLRGAELATGDVLWIAEADDSCEPDFIETVGPSFRVPSMTLAYCQSRKIDADGRTVADDCLPYVRDISPHRWNSDFINGAEREVSYFRNKTPIPNVSGVLFRRDALVETLKDNIDLVRRFGLAGDWIAYVLLLKRGGMVAYHARALNRFRVHAESHRKTHSPAIRKAEDDAVRRVIAALIG